MHWRYPARSPSLACRNGVAFDGASPNSFAIFTHARARLLLYEVDALMRWMESNSDTRNLKNHFDPRCLRNHFPAALATRSGDDLSVVRFLIR
jgi:hypothetical protein